MVCSGKRKSQSGNHLGRPLRPRRWGDEKLRPGKGTAPCGSRKRECRSIHPIGSPHSDGLFLRISYSHDQLPGTACKKDFQTIRFEKASTIAEPFPCDFCSSHITGMPLIKCRVGERDVEKRCTANSAIRGDLYSMKKIGFLSFGHWAPSPQSRTQSGSDALLQSIDLAVEAERLGMDGAFFRVLHFAQQLASPFPLLAAVGAKTRKIEIGTAVIDMRYENPHHMAEDAGAADLIAGGRL